MQQHTSTMVGGVEVACVVIIVLENVICHACNQHSWLHTQLRLPYMVWAPARSPFKPFGPPDTYWGFDVLQPAQLVRVDCMVAVQCFRPHTKRPQVTQQEALHQ